MREAAIDHVRKQIRYTSVDATSRFSMLVKLE